MNTESFTDIAITETAREEFAKKIEIARMLVRDMQAGVTARASVFRVKGGNVYVLVRSAKDMTLGEVMNIGRNMGIEANDYLPPGGIGEYFNDEAIKRYKDVFPGKPIQRNAEELRYYRTLAPYSPALIRVARISGELREYEPRTRQWHVVKRLTYNKINAQE